VTSWLILRLKELTCEYTSVVEFVDRQKLQVIRAGANKISKSTGIPISKRKWKGTKNDKGRLLKV